MKYVANIEQTMHLAAYLQIGFSENLKVKGEQQSCLPI